MMVLWVEVLVPKPDALASILTHRRGGTGMKYWTTEDFCTLSRRWETVSRKEGCITSVPATKGRRGQWISVSSRLA